MNPGFENNLSEGSVLKKLILFALPLLASNVVQSLYNVADMFIVGNFSGSAAMSGVNIGGQVTFILTNVVIGLCVGTTILIGQYVGAGNQGGLKKVTSTIITLLLFLAVFFTVLMLALKDHILRLINTPAEAFAESSDYLAVTVLGVIFIFGYNALSAILRGMGDSRRPFYFVLTACVLNVILDLLFVAVFHWSAFGAALATIISQAASMTCCIVYMVKHKFHFDFKPSSFRIDKTQLSMIFRFGLPTCIQSSITGLSFLFVTAIVNLVGGVHASAAVGAAGKFNSFVFMPVMAMSSSVSIMSAQNFGAGRPDRAAYACRIGIAVSAVISFAFFLFVQISPSSVITLFTHDAAVVENGVVFLRSFCIEYLIIPFMFCLNGLLMGGGHTTFTLINSIISSVLLRAPVSYILGVYFGWGIFGVGMAAPTASAGVLLMIIGYLLSGRWKHNAVKSAADTR